MDVLERILHAKRQELKLQKEQLPMRRAVELASAAAPPHDFVAAVRRPDRINIIAEVKRAIYAQRTARDGRVGYYHPQLDGPECCYDRAERTNV